jgi:hypothetical protein
MTGVEPAPSGFTGQRSNQLSYIHRASALFYFVFSCSRLPPELPRGSAPVTICATNLALGDFLLDSFPSDAIRNHLRYAFAFPSSDMVEFKHYDIRFAAIDARMLREVSVAQPLVA